MPGQLIYTGADMAFAPSSGQLNLFFAFSEPPSLVIGVSVVTGGAANALAVFFAKLIDLGNR